MYITTDYGYFYKFVNDYSIASIRKFFFIYNFGFWVTIPNLANLKKDWYKERNICLK